MSSEDVGDITSHEDVDDITLMSVLRVATATWPRRVLILVVVLIPMIVWVTGGFTPVPPQKTSATANEPINLGPMTITPKGFFVSDQVDRNYLKNTKGAVAYLGVMLTLTNTTDAPSGVLSRAFMPNFPASAVLPEQEYPDRAYRVADGSILIQALPSITSDIVLLWPVGSDIEGSTFTVSFEHSRWDRSILLGDYRWLVGGDIENVVVPRVEVPETLLDKKAS